MINPSNVFVICMYIYICVCVCVCTLCVKSLSTFHVRTTGNKSYKSQNSEFLKKKNHTKGGCFYTLVFVRFRLVAGGLRLRSHESRCI